jgi:hypothetical protein
MIIKIFSKNKHGVHKITLDENSLKLYQSKTWSIAKNGNNFYLYHTKRISKTKTITTKFHRELLDLTDKNLVCDHVNGDGLDNRLENLRKCTVQENSQNRRKTYGSSKYLGVTYHKPSKKWYAQIETNKKCFFLGSYSTQEEAARAYNKKALELFGTFAKLNEV